MEPQVISPERLKAFIAHSLHTDLDCNCTDITKIIRNEFSPPVLHFPDSTSLLQEKVFLIDYIAETIFFRLDDKATLLDCRLVSLRWAYFSAKALQKLVTIKFYPFFRPPPLKLYIDHFYYWWNIKRPIRDLVEVMNNSHEFPCSSFSFRICRKKPDDLVTQPLEQLFMTHASRIEKLHIEGDVSSDDLTHIICVLPLNVKELLLGELRIWIEESEAQNPLPAEYDLEDEVERIRKVTFLDTTLKSLSLNRPRTVLKNLHIFKSNGTMPNTLIRQVLESSPNLVEVYVDQHNLQCLVKPTNRLHLVKKLDINFYDFDRDTESLELVADNHGDNWAVEEMSFCGDTDTEYDEQLEKLVVIIEKILRGCAATCREIKWYNTLMNLRIPQMRKVEHLTFNYHEDYKTGLPFKLFPDGTSLGGAFPNLNSLLINLVHARGKVSVENIFGHGDDQLSFPNVKEVMLLSRAPVNEILQQSLERMFLNAVFGTNGSLLNSPSKK